jgi:putative membrane protein
MNTTTRCAAFAVLCSLAMFPAVGCRSADRAADDGTASAAAAPDAPAKGTSSAGKPAPAAAAGMAAASAAGSLDPAAPVVVDYSLEPSAFTKSVAKTDLLEIALANLVLAQGETPAVKDFAKRMLTNHTAIQVIVTKVAADTQVELPTALDADDEATVARFAAMNGVALDKAYMAYLAEQHPKTLASYRWQYDNCKDPVVKAFIGGTMPIVGTQQRTAESLNAEVNKEEIRLAAEQKAAEQKAAEEAKAKAAADAAAGSSKKKGKSSNFSAKKPTGS